MARLKNVLEVISQAAMEIGIAQAPAASVVSTSDQDIIQLRSLLYSVADEIMVDEPYQEALNEGFWLADQDGITLKEKITTDSDLVLFDSRLAVNGLKFRFLKSKGLEFGEELRDFTVRMNKLAGAMNARVLDLDLEESRQI
jgi:hypothetical protein